MNLGGESGVDPNKEVNKEAGFKQFIWGKQRNCSLGHADCCKLPASPKRQRESAFGGVLGGNWEEQEFEVVVSHWPQVVVNAVAGAGRDHLAFKSRR